MRLEQFVSEHGQPRRLDPGEHLFRQGDNVQEGAYLQSGLLKAYYLDANGREAIKSFFIPVGLVGSLRSSFEAAPAPYGVVAMEPTRLAVLPLLKLRETAQQDLELANELIELLIALSIKKERREHDFLQLSAEAQYRQLQVEVPDLLKRVSQSEIARYLGITPVALSRIRGRIARRSADT
jgi:CRP-like cAMP-binding protein